MIGLTPAELESVVIYDDPYKVGKETVHQYQAYCRRCMRNVASPGLRGGNSVWATKAPAVRAAKYHLTNHERFEPTTRRDVKIIETVTLPR